MGNVVAVGLLGMGIIGAATTTVATQLVAAGALAWLAATREGRLRPALTVPTRGAAWVWQAWLLRGGGVGRRLQSCICVSAPVLEEHLKRKEQQAAATQQTSP